MDHRRALGRASRLTVMTGIVLAIATLMAPVAAAANRLNVDVNLPAGFRISGKVMTASGAGIPNASVSAFNAGFTDFGFTTTNASGNYTLQGLEAGSYQVQFNPPSNVNNRGGFFKAEPPNNYTANSSDATAVVVGPSKTGISTRLPVGRTISGKIMNRAGTGISGVSVFASGPSFKGATTDASGNYRIVGLADGDYRLSVSPPLGSNYQAGYIGPTGPNNFVKSFAAAAVVHVPPNKTNVNSRLPSALTISGRITNVAGAALSGVGVSGSGPVFRSAITNSSGNYTLRGLDPGDYTLSFAPPGNYQEGFFTTENTNHFTRDKGSADPVRVGPNRTGVNAKLPTAFKISGKITNNAGAPIAGAFVAASGASSAFAVTNASGNYVLQGLEQGSHKVMVTGPGNYRSGWWRISGAAHFSDTEAGASNITVGPNKVANMKLPAGFIIGDLVKGNGTPVAGAFITATGPSSKGTVSSSATTNNYRIQGLRAGTYIVAVSAPFGSNLLDGWYRQNAPNNFTTNQSLATPVTIGP